MTGRRRTRSSTRGVLHFRLFLRRIAASVAALLLLSSPLSEALHTVLVPHAICAEHGEVIHLQGARAGTRDPSATDQNPRFDTNGVAAESGHEHCPVVAASSRRAAARPNTESLLLPAAASSDVARLKVATHPDSSLELVLLAPKTSPPLAA